jgi:hypothetical protein
MSSVTAIQPVPWIRSASYDMALLLGTALLAFVCAGLLSSQPTLFPMVYLFDLWGLGYPHVISTFTRFPFRTDETETDRFLLRTLPLLCLGGILGLYFMAGTWLVVTVYFYWQWFHTMRQGYGIARIYQRKYPEVSPYYDALCMALVYAIPTWGILRWSHLNPAKFLYLDLRCIPTPEWLVQVAAVISCTLLVLWTLQQIRLYLRGKLLWTHSLFILTHSVVFGLGYLWLDDINTGFVITNVWHNSQYLLMVWMANSKDLPRADIPALPAALSAISQDKNAPLFYLFCFGIAVVVYAGIHQANAWLVALLPVSVIAAQTINFHHFIVDTYIWKKRTGFRKVNAGG